MRRKVRRGYAAAAVMAVSIALLALSMVAPMISTSTDFSIYNSGWNGTSRLAISTYQLGKFAPSFSFERTGADITIAQRGFAELQLDPRTDSLVVIGPTKPFSDRDGEIVGQFVRAGGVLLLADDFGTGNQLLEKIGSSSRISNKLVMDLSFEKQPEFSVCFNLEPDTLTRNVSRLLLNYPSSLQVDRGTTDVIATSSVASYLDLDGDRTHSLGEPRGPFPILARERLESGTIILLSDPSVLINGMRDQMDNEALAQNLVEEISSLRTSVYFDESHREYFDPIAVTTQFTGALSTNAKVGLLILAFALLLWVSTDLVDRAVGLAVRAVRNGWRRMMSLLFGRGKEEAPSPARAMSVEELADEVAREHPEWKRGLIRHALRERERHGEFLERGRT